jgi:hypothetical protein
MSLNSRWSSKANGDMDSYIAKLFSARTPYTYLQAQQATDISYESAFFVSSRK